MLEGTTAIPIILIFASLSILNAFNIGLSLSKCLLWNRVVIWNVRGYFQIEFFLLLGSFGLRNKIISSEEKEEKVFDKFVIDL